MKIFLICPVRDANKEQLEKLDNYIATLESSGHKVHYPKRDTNQNDETGFRICSQNADAIKNSDEVHIFFDPSSQGSLFDLGVAFAFSKKLIIANIDELTPTVGKSFTNMILEWNRKNV